MRSCTKCARFGAKIQARLAMRQLGAYRSSASTRRLGAVSLATGAATSRSTRRAASGETDSEQDPLAGVRRKPAERIYCVGSSRRAAAPALRAGRAQRPKIRSARSRSLGARAAVAGSQWRLPRRPGARRCRNRAWRPSTCASVSSGTGCPRRAGPCGRPAAESARSGERNRPGGSVKGRRANGRRRRQAVPRRTARRRGRPARVATSNQPISLAGASPRAASVVREQLGCPGRCPGRGGGTRRARGGGSSRRISRAGR